jgi:hypothetical protein
VLRHSGKGFYRAPHASVFSVHARAPSNVLVAGASAQGEPTRVSVLDQAEEKPTLLMMERITQLAGLWAVVCVQADY